MNELTNCSSSCGPNSFPYSTAFEIRRDAPVSNRMQDILY